MRYWLLKSEPDVFGYPDLERVGREEWNGVRNYQARNFLREMNVGDLALFYHSNASPPGVAGVARVVRTAVPDDLQFDETSPYFDPRSSRHDPRWSMVQVAPVAALPTFVTLDALRALPELSDFALVRRGNRLSVLPVTPAQMEAVLRAGGTSMEKLTAVGV